MPKYLLGSTFPLSLIRRQVTIQPISIDKAKSFLAEGGYSSYWGHENTLTAAEEALGLSVRPSISRPSVTLTSDLLPQLDGYSFREAIILSPSYAAGFRPQIGMEVPAESVISWETLLIQWAA